MTKSISITCKTGELIEISKLERFQGDLKEITPEAMALTRGTAAVQH